MVKHNHLQVLQKLGDYSSDFSAYVHEVII